MYVARSCHALTLAVIALRTVWSCVYWEQQPHQLHPQGTFCHVSQGIALPAAVPQQPPPWQVPASKAAARHLLAAAAACVLVTQQ